MRNPGADWAGKIRVKGDFRYRHEQIDDASLTTDRLRHRVRVRLGVEAKVNDTKARTDTKMKEVLKPEQYDTWTKEVAPSFFQDPFRGGGR